MGLMLESTSERLSARGGPHFGSPDKAPARTARHARGRRRGARSVHDRDPDRHRRDAGRAARRAARDPRARGALRPRAGGDRPELPREARDADGGRAGAAARGAALDDRGRAASCSVPTRTCRRRRTSPTTTSRACSTRASTTGAASRRSRSTTSTPRRRGRSVERLRAATESRGLELAPRLPVYPEWISGRGSTRASCRPCCARSDALGLAREDRWSPGEDGGVPFVPRDALPVDTRDELGEEELVRLFRARGDGARPRLRGAPTALRREVCGDEVTLRRHAQHPVHERLLLPLRLLRLLEGEARGEPARRAVPRPARRDRPPLRGGVGARGDGGLPAGRHPSRRSPATTTSPSCARSRRQCPICTCTRSRRSRSGRARRRSGCRSTTYLAELRDAGLGSLPGTAAEILDDEVRRVICPDKVTTEQWLEVHDAAHRVGLRSNVTMMFGHVESPRSWARHLLHAREQQRRSGGFTEFVPLPFVHMEAPMWLRGQARSGPTFGETLLVHAVARLALHPWITNIQVSWVKLGPRGRRRRAARGRQRPRRDADERVDLALRRAQSTVRSSRPRRWRSSIRSAGRIPRQRTTLYGDVPEERRLASFGAAPLAEPLEPAGQGRALVAPPRLSPGFAVAALWLIVTRRAPGFAGSGLETEQVVDRLAAADQLARRRRRRARPPVAARRCSSTPSRACSAPVAGTASRSPRRGSGSSTASIRMSPDSQCLPAMRYVAGRGSAGAVREQRFVARAVELRPRVVRHAAVDRGVRRSSSLDGSDLVQRHARPVRRASGPARGSAAPAPASGRAGAATARRANSSARAAASSRLCRTPRPPPRLKTARRPVDAQRSATSTRRSTASRLSDVRVSCEPMCTCSPATSRPAPRAASNAATASSARARTSTRRVPS